MTNRESAKPVLTDWGRVTHICVSKIIIIGSDNGLSPGRRQAIIWINAGVLLTGPLGTNFSEILNGIKIFSLNKMLLKISSAKWRPFCQGLNVLIDFRNLKFTDLQQCPTGWQEPLCKNYSAQTKADDKDLCHTRFSSGHPNLWKYVHFMIWMIWSCQKVCCICNYNPVHVNQDLHGLQVITL